MRDSPAARVFHVTTTSPFLGTRSHQQHWRRADDGRWRFDAHATITGRRR